MFWFNGEIREEVKIDVLNHSLHYGSAVFEGIRCYETAKGPAVFRLKEHIERLFHSAEVMGMSVPYSQKEILSAVKEVVKVNGFKECYIRPIFFYGEKMGLLPKEAPVNCVVAAWPWGKYLKKDAVAVKISSFSRINPHSLVMTAKVSGHYVNSIIASLEANREGCDEALLLDEEGCVAEGPGENIFFVKEDVFYTPKKGLILPGITRDSVIEIIKEKGYAVEEIKIKREDLQNYDEAFFVGTAVEVNAIASIDDTVFSCREKTEEIKTAYNDAVRNNEKWISYV